MSNTRSTYSEAVIMNALFTGDYTALGGSFEDDELTRVHDGLFYGASNLTSVSIPNATQIGANAFYGNTLTTLNLSWGKITSVGSAAFYNCSLPSSCEDLVLSSVTTLGAGVFGRSSTSVGSAWLKTFSAPLWNGNITKENYRVITPSSNGIFTEQRNLVSVNLPSLINIPNSLFQFCTNLTEVDFPKVSNIESNAFTGCSKLKKIRVGGAITSLSYIFLSSASAFESLILSGLTSVPTLGSNTFRNTRIASGVAYVYVPKALEDTIKAASIWSTYASQIRAIEDYPEICDY